MAYDLEDTIAAIGTAPGGAARGMVRISGPRAISCLAECFAADRSRELPTAGVAARVISGTLRVAQASLALPCDVFLWPTARSYTRQPTAEVHTLGSSPLLEAALQEICVRGARLAQPGEFTLRAFLAGRLDLPQAEAVLGIIDARGQQDLQHAIAQLAGGLSRPLAKLREQLLQVLAEVEAGLDFVEEDIEFISPAHLRNELGEARQIVAAIQQQMSSRTGADRLPRVVLVGAPNAGKSSLFNTLTQCFAGDRSNPPAIVSEISGTTRDYLTSVVVLGGVPCEIVDTAGEAPLVDGATILGAAQEMTQAARRRADLLLRCIDCTAGQTPGEPASAIELLVFTKADRVDDAPESTNGALHCSAVTRVGLDALEQEIGKRLQAATSAAAGIVASTSARCTDSLRLADQSLDRAIGLVDGSRSEECIAAELRSALQELGLVVGAVYTDDILDRIFSQFCIGK